MGSLLVICGRSGAGKSTIAGALINRSPDFHMVLSLTTRPRRVTDLPGEYEYLTHQSLNVRRRESVFLWEEAHGKGIYATDQADVLAALASPGIGIMILTPHVLHQLQRFLDDHDAGNACTWVYVEQPPYDVLMQRMSSSRMQEMYQRRVAEERWDAIACGHPHMRSISNLGTIDETVERIMALLP